MSKIQEKRRRKRWRRRRMVARQIHSLALLPLKALTVNNAKKHGAIF